VSSPAHLTLSGNALLAALPHAALAGLQFSHVTLPQREVCFDAGDLIQRVYFPTGGLISLVVSTDKGDLIEAGIIGREGAAGLQSILGQRFFFSTRSRPDCGDFSCSFRRGFKAGNRS
jgi:CRP-like cAMP-binding protein